MIKLIFNINVIINKHPSLLIDSTRNRNLILVLKRRPLICAVWSPAGKGLTSWLPFVVYAVSLSLSPWHPGSGVVLDCIYS